MQVWDMAASHSSKAAALAAQSSSLLCATTTASPSASNTSNLSNDTGAVVRLHSALIAVLTHLVGKLRSAALANEHIASVVYPLLRFSTSIGGAESEVLCEEAFRLWSVTLGSLPQVCSGTVCVSFISTMGDTKCT